MLAGGEPLGAGTLIMERSLGMTVEQEGKAGEAKEHDAHVTIFGQLILNLARVGRGRVGIGVDRN